MLRDFAWLKPLRVFRRDPLYANSFYLMANTLTSSALAFAFWCLAARIYMPAEVGLATAVVSAVYLLVSLSSLGLGFGLIKFLPRSENPIELINFCFTVLLLVGLIVSLIFFAGIPFWCPALNVLSRTTFFLFLFVLFTLSLILHQTLDQAFVAKRQAGFVLLKNITGGVLRLFFLILFLSFRMGSFAILNSFFIAILLMVFISIFWLLPRVEQGYRFVPVLSNISVYKLFRFSLGNYLATVLRSMPQTVLPLIVVNLLGPESGAYFYIPWMLGIMLISFSAASSQSLFAETSNNETAAATNIKRSIILGLSVVVPLVLLLVMGSNKFLVLVGKDYSTISSSLLKILALAAIPGTIVFISFGLMQGRAEIGKLIGCTVAIACLSILLGYLFVVRWGLMGIGVAWLITLVLILIPILGYIYSVLKKQPGIVSS